MMNLLPLLFACWGDNAYIVEGTVIEVTGPDTVVVKHEDIPGLMPAMTMPFHVRDPAQLEGVRPGSTILARLEVVEAGHELAKLRVTGHRPLPAPAKADGPAPLRPGEQLPATRVVLEDGTEAVLGAGQGKPTVLTFLYTRCPIPEFCPATVARFQALQAAVDPSVRLLAVTLDNAYDTPEVLSAFGKVSSADPAIWRFGRVEDLPTLALQSGLHVSREGEEIVHSIRVVVLDADGVVQHRYDDHDWPVDELLAHIR